MMQFIFLTKTVLNSGFNPSKKKNNGFKNRTLKKSVLQNYFWGLVVGDSCSVGVIMEAYCVSFLMKRTFKIYNQQRPYSPKTVSLIGCAEFCSQEGGIG